MTVAWVLFIIERPFSKNSKTPYRNKVSSHAVVKASLWKIDKNKRLLKQQLK